MTCIVSRMRSVLSTGRSHLEGFSDDLGGEWGDSIQLVAGRPARIGGVCRAGQPTTDDATEIVNQYVMVLDATVGIARDAIEDLDDDNRIDDESGLFEHLATNPFFEGFAEFECASRQGPFAFERRLSALDEQDAVLVEDHGSDANDRPLRIFAGHQSLIGLSYSPSKTVLDMLKRPPSNLSSPVTWPKASNATT